MTKQAFKTESKRLLDMMIHSIYTHREIFIRELISNASDAIDKLHIESLDNKELRDNLDPYEITIELDKENRQFILSDNGIGMTAEELEENLGTIAKSGSLDFRKALEENKDEVDIIGQFGVGFYSAFMVADRITVTTRAAMHDTAYQWTSEGEEGYEISEASKDTIGTTIVLDLRENTEDDNYDEYLETYTVQNLIKKYSDYVRYPICMDIEHTSPKKDDEGNIIEDEYDVTVEHETINSMVPLWKKPKSEITDEDYNDFFKSKFNEFQDPMKVIHATLEGTITFTMLLYIPSSTPYNFYSQDYEKGLQLYTKNVFIMDKAADLIPECFRFVKGLVDSDDLNLNISREILQQDRQLRAIAKTIEKRIKSELLKMQQKDFDTYKTFFDNFGRQIKYGVYDQFGAKKELLKDLLIFKSSYEDEYTTLAHYVNRMKEDQEFIYFASGESIEKINALPQMEKVKDAGYEVLYFTDDVDEFAIQSLMEYEEKTFKSVNQGDLDLDTEEEKKELEEKQEQNKDLLELLKTALEGKVSDVKLSSRLKSHPVCLVSGEGLSFEMEKVIAQMPDSTGMGMKAERILEINPEHKIFTTLEKLMESDQDLVKDYADLLYNQAVLIEGFTIDDPIDFSNKLCDLMSRIDD
jgi:molecular chaperone HtpG